MAMTEGAIHICWAHGYFEGQIHRRGHRKWETVTGKCKSEKSAMKKAVDAMTYDHNRARVIMMEEWYGPTVMMELKR